MNCSVCGSSRLLHVCVLGGVTSLLPLSSRHRLPSVLTMFPTRCSLDSFASYPLMDNKVGRQRKLSGILSPRRYLSYVLYPSNVSVLVTQFVLEQQTCCCTMYHRYKFYIRIEFDMSDHFAVIGLKIMNANFAVFATIDGDLRAKREALDAVTLHPTLPHEKDKENSLMEADDRGQLVKSKTMSTVGRPLRDAQNQVSVLCNGCSVAIRALYCRSRGPGYGSTCCYFETWAVSFIPHCMCL